MYHSVHTHACHYIQMILGTLYSTSILNTRHQYLLIDGYTSCRDGHLNVIQCIHMYMYIYVQLGVTNESDNYRDTVKKKNLRIRIHGNSHASLNHNVLCMHVKSMLHVHWRG